MGSISRNISDIKQGIDSYCHEVFTKTVFPLQVQNNLIVEAQNTFSWLVLYLLTLGHLIFGDYKEYPF